MKIDYYTVDFLKIKPQSAFFAKRTDKRLKN